MNDQDGQEHEDEADELNLCRVCGRRAPGRQCFDCTRGDRYEQRPSANASHGRMRTTLPPDWQDNPTPLS